MGLGALQGEGQARKRKGTPRAALPEELKRWKRVVKVSHLLIWVSLALPPSPSFLSSGLTNSTDPQMSVTLLCARPWTGVTKMSKA